MMIVLPVIYGVFSSGIKLYHKIQVEEQLRDDADYTATMIMNTFYSFPFDYVRECGENCIELVDSTHTAIEEVKEKVRDKQTFYSIDQKKENERENSIKLELGEIEKDGEKISIFLIDGKPIDAVSDFSDSELSLSCSKCEEGMISLNFHLDDKRLRKPLELKSQFGF
nr:hypothetical protein [Bacillus sp. FJAT-29790]